uniref:DUF499 domain-containing protein n=1 Tax=Methylorubrum thiocyanatum TaxID=47958 RepID=UPI0035C7BE89
SCSTDPSFRMRAGQGARSLSSWSGEVEASALQAIKPREKALHVVTESLHNQRIKNLWDLFSDGHPEANFFQGAWGGRTEVPSKDALLKTLKRCPTALILDEFQTWFDGLTNTKAAPRQTWNFNFIQMLSEIAAEEPDLLVLVVSIRNGETEAYKQVHRVSPVLVDFKAGGSPERIQADRRRMLLHRLFSNRRNIPIDGIERLLANHVSERFRLDDTPEADKTRLRALFSEAWPFSPDLLALLEDQILVATDAQETRDLIKILANLFRSRGEYAEILTAADVRIDDDKTGIGALLDSVSTQRFRALREVALRNMEAVRNAIGPSEVLNKCPHYKEIVSSIWLRSISAGNQLGALRSSVHIDLTKRLPVDDNVYAEEVSLVVENSFNLHDVGGRLIFREDENPDAKLKAGARNSKNFLAGEDKLQLAQIIRHVLTGNDDGGSQRVIVLPSNWLDDPWSALAPEDKPTGWGDKIPILVIPETPRDPEATLGEWLKKHVTERRNVPRYLLPKKEAGGIYADSEMLFYARMDVLGAKWDGEYKRLAQRHRDHELKPRIKKLFNKLLVLSNWDFQKPTEAQFITEGIELNGEAAAKVIAEKVRKDVFEPETLDEFVLEAATAAKTLKGALDDLANPRPGGARTVIWLGKTEMIDKIVRICARGEIALTIREDLVQAAPGEAEEAALSRIRSRIGGNAYQSPETVHLALPRAELGSQTTPKVPEGGKTAPPPSPLPVVGSGADTGPTTGTSVNPVGNVFFGNGTTKPSRVLAADNPTSSLNLIGQLETWRIKPATRVRNVKVTVGEATGAQIDALIKKLPDGLIFGIEMEAEED